MDDLLLKASQQLLTAHCTPQTVRDVEAGQSAQPLWAVIEASGFGDTMVDESRGGAQMGLSAVYPLLELCGSLCLPVPLAQTMLVRAVLGKAGLAAPSGSVALAQAPQPGFEIFESGRLAMPLVCSNVPFGQVADWVLVGGATMGLLLPSASAQKTPSGFGLGADLHWPALARDAAQLIPFSCDTKTWDACLHAGLLAGAMQAVFSRTLQYANERQQFGRAISKFQAIQHQLSVIAEHTFAARMAAQMGCVSESHLPQRLAVAVAKARTGEAAAEVAALAHSIHGAIGFTQAFDLQLYTRRLHWWRQTAGSESYWHDVLGQALVDDHPGMALDMLLKASQTSLTQEHLT